MVTRKKKRVLIISLIIVVLVIIGIVLALLYLTTDMFKSSKTLFAKYVGQNMQYLESLQNSIQPAEFEKNLENQKYTEQLEAKVNYTQNVGNTMESTDNSINRLSVTLEGQTDKANNYTYKKAQLLNGEEENFTLEYLEDEGKQAVKFTDLFLQYIAADNGTLPELLADAGYSEEQIKNVPTIEQLNLSILQNISFSTEEIQTLQEKYINIVNENISQESFSKLSNQTVTIENNSYTANAYVLTLTTEQINNLYVKILEAVQADELILGKIGNIDTLYGTSLRDDFVSKIKNEIEEINRNNIGSEENKIIVYESDMQTISTVIQGVDYQIQFNYLNTGNELAQYIYTKNEEEVQKITWNKEADSIDILLEYKEGEDDVTVTCNLDNTTQDNSLEKQLSVVYEKGTNKVELNLTHTKEAVSNFSDEVKLAEQERIELNNLSEEDLVSILARVEESLTNKIESLKTEINIDDINEVLKEVGLMEETYVIEPIEGEITEAEKNRFNSNFEILQGENIDKDGILEIVEIIKNNFLNLEVASSTVLKIEISQTESNPDLVERFKTYIEERRNMTYDVGVEYDETTDLVKYITLTIHEEE